VNILVSYLLQIEDGDVQEVLHGIARRCSANNYGINNQTCMNMVQRSSICRSESHLRAHVPAELAARTMSNYTVELSLLRY
jgi:hypothetical protein